MGKIIDFDSNGSFDVSEVVCIDCKTRFVCCRPAGIGLKHLECHGCGKFGFIIETGEQHNNYDGQEVIEYMRKPI